MYIGNDLQIAHPSYKIIDDISSGFNGSQTSFALQVSGATPVPFPISTQQVMISVNGVVQEPDPNGSAGFKLLGSNIVFSSAPANGHAFFGVINAGADYVTAGSEFPDGSATAPSFTFQDDQDTGWFRSGSGAVGFSANGVNTIGFDGNGLTVTGDATFTGDSSKNMFWDKSDGALEFVDNAKLKFGAELEIYSAGTASYIKDTGTGNLNFNVDNLIIASADDTATIAKFKEADACELYFNNALKLATKSTGVDITGNITSGSLTVDTNTLHVDATNNRVGIGTTSPIEKLQATGAIVSSGSNNTSSTAGANRSIIDFTSGGTRIGHFRGTTSAGSGSVKFFVDSSEKMQLDSSGRLLIGATSSTSVGGENNQLQIEGTTAPTSNVSLTRNSNDAGGCFLKFGKSRGTSTGSNTIVQSGDTIGGIVFNAADGVDKDIAAASITAHIDGTPGANDLPGRLVFKTTADGAAISTERMRIDSSGRLLLGTTTEGSGAADNLTIADSGNCGLSIRSGTSNYGSIFFSDGTSGDDEYRGNIEYNHSNNQLKLNTNAATALTLDSSQNATFAGTVSDSKGNLRSIPNVDKTSAHTVSAANAGRAIYISSGGVTVPNSVMSAGDAVTIINNSGSDQTITQGSGLTIYNTADASTGNRTLAGRGMATIWFHSASTAYISGAGLS
jgi:hypothetical protein